MTADLFLLSNKGYSSVGGAGGHVTGIGAPDWMASSMFVNKCHAGGHVTGMGAPDWMASSIFVNKCHVLHMRLFYFMAIFIYLSK